MAPLFIPVAPPGLMAKIMGQFKDNIAAARLQKGDKLPGERQMAEIKQAFRKVWEEFGPQLDPKMVELIAARQK